MRRDHELVGFDHYLPLPTNRNRSLMSQPMIDPVNERPRWDRHAALGRVFDAINELTEPRFVREPHEVEILDESTGRLLKRIPSTHVHTLSSLLEALRAAIQPGIDLSNTDQTQAASYESRPAARLDPIRVFRSIDDGSKLWTQRMQQKRTTLTARLVAVKGSAGQLSDSDVRDLDRDVQRWWRDARLATGEDPAAMVTNLACPYCEQRKLLVGGNLDWARCRNPDCLTFWPAEWIGILGQALQASATVETLAAPARCDVARDGERCVVRGSHDFHQDDRGRYWPNAEETT